jgi:CBS domain-containing protein
MHDKLSSVLRHKGPQVQQVSPAASVLDAVRQMNAQRIGSLLVTENDRVVGIFSERDVLSRVLDQGKDPAETPVAEVMTTDVVTVSPSTTVEDALSVISEKRCRHLPVMDGDSLLGLVSIGDLTRWVTRHHEAHIQDLVKYITRKYPA